MTLAHSGWPDQKKIFMLLEESTGGELSEGWFMDFRIEVKIKAFQGLFRLQSTSGKPSAQLFKIPPFHLIAQQDVQELTETPLFSHRLGDTGGQGFGNAGEFQSGEFWFEQRQFIHEDSAFPSGSKYPNCRWKRNMS